MDAKRDAKLKFLPRHLQKGQPAANKSKRRVTVEDENVGDEDSDRRSVFDRLGPGSGGREKSNQPCYEFLETGKCPNGKFCQYSHIASKGKGGNKRDGDKSPDLRLRFKGQGGAKDKDTKLRSQVFVRKPGAGSDDDSEEGSDSWSADKLESKKEFLELEQKRKEIQQALNALEGGSDDGSAGEIKNSDSDSSQDRGNKKKKDKTSKKREKKKNKKIDGDASDKLKRKHDSDDDKTSPHKKRKKKKKGQEIVADSSSSGKYKKPALPFTGSKSSDLYNPESPTPAKEGSHDEKRTGSLSPSPKNKGKKKKKKGGKELHDSNKGKKLLSPLFKVLKKKGPESVSSKRSRSPSHDSAPVRKRSRSPSSSSSSSTSPSPSRKRKSRASSSKDPARKKAKSNEKKKHSNRPRGDSSSSDSSSSQHSARGRKGKPSGSGSRIRKDRSASISTGQRGNQPDRKKQDVKNSDPKRRSEDRGRPNERRGRRVDRANEHTSPGVVRRTVSNSMKGGSRDRDNSRSNSRRDMKTSRDVKGESARPSERDREKDRDKDRDSSRGGAKDARKDAIPQRDRDRNEKDRPLGDRDRGRDRSSGRERGSERDREKESGRVETSKDDPRGSRNDRNKEIGRGNRDRDGGRNERDRDGGRSERESGRNDRETVRGEKDMGRRDRENVRGDREYVRGERENVRGEREVIRGECEAIRGDRETGRGERERGDREIPRGEREIPRGEREMLRDERDLPRGEREILRGERDMLRGEREIPRGERELLRGDREMLRGDRGRDNIGRGERLRRGGSLDRDLMDDFNMPPHMNRPGGRFGDQMPFEEPGPLLGGDPGPMLVPFLGERQRAFGRGAPDFDRREGRGFDRMERGRPGFHGMGPGRDRSWEGGRDNRGRGSSFGEFRGDDRAREFGGIRDDRRGGHEERLLPFPPGGSNDRDIDRGRIVDKEQMLPPLDDFRGREDNWKRREGSRDSNDRDSSRNRRGDEGENNTSRERGPPGNLKDKRGERDQVGKDSANQGSRFNNKNQSMKAKEESPSLGKDEHSLANLFSQTETIGKKKPVTKSFGGKKSPRGSDEPKKTTEKSKTTVKSQQSNTKGTRSDKKAPPVKSGQNTRNNDKSTDKEDDGLKHKFSRSVSPTPSQKSSHSVRSGQKRSRSPDVKASSNSPAPNQGSRRESLSPTPISSKENDTEIRTAGLTNVPFSRKEDANNTVNNKPPRSRSQSLSEPETPVIKTPAVQARRKSSDNESQPENAKDEEGDIAFAMGGDSVDDEQVFSDWSEDDDADNILDQPDDYDNPYFEIDPRHRPNPPGVRFQDQRHNRTVEFDRDGLGDLFSERAALEQNIPGVKILEDVQKEKPAREQRRRNEDDENYEDISSDENDLDEEGERLNKRTIVSILDIDMSALMDQAKPRATPGPVFQRFKASSVFASLGLSRTFAGEGLFAEVQKVCQTELQALADAEGRTDDVPATDESANDQNISTKQPKVEASKETELMVKVKIEPGLEVIDNESPTLNDDSNTEKDPSTENANVMPALPEKSNPLTSVFRPDFRLYGNTSALHKHFKAKSNQKPVLLNNAGLFRRALTARKDLDIRRQLCNIDPKFDQGAVYPSGSAEPEIARHCLQIFRQHRPVGLTPLRSTTSITEERQC